MQVNASDETPEVNDQAQPEDSQTAPVAEKVKDFFKNNKKAIIPTAVVVATGLAAIAKERAEERYADEDIETEEPFPDPGTEDFEPSPEGADRQRRSPPVLHNVSGGPVKLSGGRLASEVAKANSRRDTGKEPEPGYTYRVNASRGVSPDRSRGEGSV
jgi:hypothetical protein